MEVIPFTYDLNGVNLATSQTASFNIVSGAGSFEIPSSLFPNVGNSHFYFKYFQHGYKLFKY